MMSKYSSCEWLAVVTFPFCDVMETSPSHNFLFLDPKKHMLNNKLKVVSYQSSTSTSCHSPLNYTAPYTIIFSTVLCFHF
jgi:hypothetical protein